jgi:hypothetical protein
MPDEILAITGSDLGGNKKKSTRKKNTAENSSPPPSVVERHPPTTAGEREGGWRGASGDRGKFPPCRLKRGMRGSELHRLGEVRVHMNVLPESIALDIRH